MSPEEEQELAKLLRKENEAKAAAAAKDDSQAPDYEDLETPAGEERSRPAVCSLTPDSARKRTHITRERRASGPAARTKHRQRAWSCINMGGRPR